MVISTFVDLQGFVVGRRFVVKEIAVLRKGAILSHYIFTCPILWNILTRKVLCFLIECLTSWIAMGRRNDPIQHGETSD